MSEPSQHVYFKPDRVPGVALALVVEPTLHGKDDAAHLAAIKANAAKLEDNPSPFVEAVEAEGYIPMIIQFDSTKVSDQISIQEFLAIPGHSPA